MRLTTIKAVGNCNNSTSKNGGSNLKGEAQKIKKLRWLKLALVAGKEEKMNIQEVKKQLAKLKEKTTGKSEGVRHAYHFFSLEDLMEEDKLQSSLEFETEGDLDFELMDFFYDGILSQIVRDARERAESKKFIYGYDWGKKYLVHFVGWYAHVPEAEQPALRTQKAYDIAIRRLSEECWAGEDERVRRLEAEEDE